MATHRLSAGPETVRWGMFDAAFPPLITVDSGDTVVLECVSGAPEVMPPPGSGFRIPPALAAIHASGIPRAGGHILTGPVAVAGAMPGDMLEVRIDKIELGNDWGYCGFRPLAGTLPEDFPDRYLSHIPVDRAKRTCTLPWGTELALAPFFGVMGVAPPPAYGTISTIQPREHGGNLDNKELTEGATLFLPVWAEGAKFSAGDGHGVQGDGEVCINALEICLTGTFTLILHKNPSGGGGRSPLLSLSARGDGDPFHLHGDARGPGPGDEAGVAGDDPLHHRAHQPVARAGVSVLLAGGGFPRDADGERREGRARAAAQGAAVLVRRR